MLKHFLIPALFLISITGFAQNQKSMIGNYRNIAKYTKGTLNLYDNHSFKNLTDVNRERIDRKRKHKGIICRINMNFPNLGNWNYDNDTLILTYRPNSKSERKEKFLLQDNKLYKVNFKNELEEKANYKRKNTTIETILTHGIYAEKTDKNILRFAGESFQFKEFNKFEYEFYSDDLISSKHGVGVYKIKAQKLILNFKGSSKDSSTAESQIRLAKDTSQIHYTFHVIIKKAGVDLPFVSITLSDSNKTVITGTRTDINGSASITIAKDTQPLLLKVSGVGYEPLSLPILINEGLSFEIALAQYYGERIFYTEMIREFKMNDGRIYIDRKEYVKSYAD